MERPKLSICIITYNQEDVIRRTMDSLLQQKEYIYEICINDDCSTDKTFEILQEYAKQYPGIVKPMQNERNLGIFANTETARKRLGGDMIYDIAGDDICPLGYFKAVFDYIETNKIDWENELFCIYGDYMQIGSDGSKTTFRQSLINDCNAVKLFIRKLVWGRCACYSRRILDKFEDVSDGRSFKVELAQDGQLQLFSEHNYYIPIVGNVYFAEIGVSARMSATDHLENTVGGYDMLVDFLAKHEYVLDKKDKAFIEYIKAYKSHDMTLALIYFFKSIDFSLGWQGLGINRILFVLKKKFRRKQNDS